MKKGKSIALLSIISAVLAFLLVMTFVRFPLGKTKNYNSVLGAIELDYDIAGGTAYTLSLAKDDTNDSVDTDEVIDTIKYRLSALGYESYSVKAIKGIDEAVEDYDIRIEVKGNTNEYGETDVATVTADIAVVSAFGKLQFFGGDSSNPSEEILTSGEAVIKDAKYEGSYSNDGSTTYYQVSINFTDYAYSALMDAIEKNSSYYLKIMLGDTELLSGSSPISKSYFMNKSLMITTSSEASAKQAALQIKSGGLAYKYEVSDGVSVSAPLGENAKLFLILSVAVLILAILVYIFVAFKGFGFVALLSTAFFVVVELLMMIAVPGIKLSLGGVIGIALAILLTGDGLVVTAKRISEEFANGKMVKPSVKMGFARALIPNLGVCIISAVVSILLFAIASGVVKNFAITFGIGAVISAFTTLLLAKMFTALMLSISGYKPEFFNLKRKDDVSTGAGE